MASGSNMQEELPLSGNWMREKLQGFDADQVPEPVLRSKELWEKQVNPKPIPDSKSDPSPSDKEKRSKKKHESEAATLDGVGKKVSKKKDQEKKDTKDAQQDQNIESDKGKEKEKETREKKEKKGKKEKKEKRDKREKESKGEHSTEKKKSKKKKHKKSHHDSHLSTATSAKVRTDSETSPKPHEPEGNAGSMQPITQASIGQENQAQQTLQDTLKTVAEETSPDSAIRKVINDLAHELGVSGSKDGDKVETPKATTPPPQVNVEATKTTTPPAVENNVEEQVQLQPDPIVNVVASAATPSAVEQVVVQEQPRVEEQITQLNDQGNHAVPVAAGNNEVGGNESQSDEGENSTTKDRQKPNQEEHDPDFRAIDNFTTSSAGYCRTPRTGDSKEEGDEGTSVSKPPADFYLPLHMLQSIKNLSAEEALAKLLTTYGADVPLANDKEQQLQREHEDAEQQFRRQIIEGDMITLFESDPTLYYSLKSLFSKLQTHKSGDTLAFQVTQAENFLDQYAKNYQYFTSAAEALNVQIALQTKHYDLASTENAEVNRMKTASASAFLEIAACEDNIAKWKAEIRELEEKIIQEEERKTSLAGKTVEVPKEVIEEKAKLGLRHFSEAAKAGIEVDRLTSDTNALQRKLNHTKALYAQFRQANL
ncbi:myb-like protein X [Trifolium pratense]|uniref:myb-like protein X n=1 Tax=Trifolium pratense TaxID=57577 RepID=UPI001E697349|nr:myb-like protein X [Trifolium pratense]